MIQLNGLALSGFEPSSDGFPEGLLAQRFLALGKPSALTIGALQRAYHQLL